MEQAEIKSERLRYPSLVVFASSFCLMVIELIAGRMMAPYLGVSLYTWTSVIGVILAGISLGNYLGGRLADKNASKKILGVIFLLSGAFSLTLVFFVRIFGNSLQMAPLSLLFSTLLFALLVFFPPSLFLGFISPIVVKLTLNNLAETGEVVGRIYAWSAVGSILGTFVTGYFLIAYIGTKLIIIIISIILVAIGLILEKELWSAINKKIKASFVLLFLMGLMSPYPCLKESNYYCINILKSQAGETKGALTLKLDHLVHSYVFLGNPVKLGYDYEKGFALLANYYLKNKQNFSAFFIGGGGYVFQRYLETLYPGGEIEVAEIDPEVTKINYDLLGLSKDTKIKTYNVDARIFVDRLVKEKKYDLIFGDAFNDLSVPYHLVTYEFNEQIKAHLADGGIYAVNLIDDYELGKFLASYVHTLQKTFSYVYLAPLKENWQAGGRNTFVVIASEQPLDEGRWRESNPAAVEKTEINNYKPYFYSLVDPADLEKFLAGRKPTFLTDDFVPVDNFLAPVFKNAY